MAKVSLLGALERALVRSKAVPDGLQRPDNRGSFWDRIREPYAGAWQRNDEIKVESGLSNPTVFRCISLISSDFAKMPACLKVKSSEGIWKAAESPAFSPVLRKPNHFQNRIQFYEAWSQSKLWRGNTYVLKERDARGVVVAHYILHPDRVTPLVAPNGEVYYQLATDHLAGLEAQIIVPASEIIHDRWNCLFHPLVGLSPLYACGVAAMQGVEIPRQQTRFFRNGSRPSGVLTAPGHIDPETADRVKTGWDTNFTGENVGRIAILGDGLKYEAMVMTAVDAELIAQLKWTDEKICSVFGVPAYMVGVGAAPANNNIEALAQQYYSQCLQIHIESAELCLDEGLGLIEPKGGVQYGVEFDLGALLRMDTATQIKTLTDAVKGGLLKPDEARLEINRPPVDGGAAVYLQQQNFSLAALAKRDAKEDPFATGGGQAATPPPVAAADGAANDDVAANELEANKALLAVVKGLR